MMKNSIEARALRLIADEEKSLRQSARLAAGHDVGDHIPAQVMPDEIEDEDRHETAQLPTLHPVALHGPLGQFVRQLSPETEADPVALLVQGLAAFGSCVGRGAHCRVGADRHCANLFVLLVGRTGGGRKGLSWAEVKRLFAGVDQAWRDNCLQSGLATGEGLIWAVRDAIERQEPVREKGRVVGYETVQVDPGVTDKRLLVVETEFVGVLKVAAREGNILSAVVRQAWDDGTLRGMSKTSPARATKSHISIVGHITAEELRRHLGKTEAVNGFANRFLFAFVRRSKLLPEGGQPVDLAAISAELEEALDFSQTAGELERDAGANELWHHAYPILTAARPGLLGSVTARAESQVLRLSLLYALLDRSSVVQRPHIEAAIALWDYCEASAAYVLGTSLGDPVAETILDELHRKPGGLKKSAINNLFSRHDPAGVTFALGTLQDLGLVECSVVQSGGRPGHLWRATKAVKATEGGYSSLLSLLSPASEGSDDRK